MRFGDTGSDARRLGTPRAVPWPNGRGWRFVFACFAATLLACGDVRAGGAAEVVVEVDSAKREMRVVRDGRLLAVFDHVSVGRWGVSAEKRLGDGKTPLGQFRIAWARTDGKFGPFLGFDYPSIARAEKGLVAGEISQAEFDAVREAHAQGRIPPQHTKLGGHIGIHGLGRADPRIHREMNWTKGCIALTNPQMRQLTRLVAKGAVVRVR